VKCPYCGSADARKVNECYIMEGGRRVAHYVCGGCGIRFKQVVDRGREVIVRVGYHDQYYLLLKGSLENFFHSLRDFVERRSELIRQFPADTFLWGARRADRRVKAEVGVFLYVTNTMGAGLPSTAAFSA